MKIISSGGKLHWIKNLYLRWVYGAGCCDTYTMYPFLAEKLLKPMVAFRKRTMSYPMAMSSRDWDSTLDEIIFALKFYSNDNWNDDWDAPEAEERAQKGMELFGKHFRDLWY